MELNGKYILITGANRGIGLAFAQACAKEKSHLLLAIRKTDEQLNEDLLKVGARSVEVMEADLVTREGVEALVQKLNSKKVDILFNNAGLLTGGLLEDQPLDDIYNMFQVNVNALVHLTRGLLPQMVKQKSGKVINHASVSAIMHFPCASTYAAAKAAVWAFSDCLQQELRGTGVSTLCLFTPGIKTRMFDKIDHLYSKNLEQKLDSISPEEYAVKIINAVKSDKIYLKPDGVTGIGFRMAKNFTSLFNYAISKRFHR